MPEKQHHIEEQERIARYKENGDLNVLGALYQPYMHLVYGLCLKYMKDKARSEDAVMQIFEKLIDAVKKHDIKNFKSWLYVLAKNHCLMALRSSQNQHAKKSVPFVPEIMESEVVAHPIDEEDNEQHLKNLDDCIEALDTEQKTCIQLFYLEKTSYAQITIKTGYELNKVKSYIQNGKRNLKQCMEEKE